MKRYEFLFILTLKSVLILFYFTVLHTTPQKVTLNQKHDIDENCETEKIFNNNLLMEVFGRLLSRHHVEN